MVGEFDIIRRYFAERPPLRDDVVLGIGDDAAIVAAGGEQLAIAVDAIVGGVHFPDGTPARAIGHRALAVNLSDLAAMGAVPRWATLALTLPSAESNWLADFSAGLFELARAHDVQLVGGDTVRGPLNVTVQAMGQLDGPGLRRDGGRVGDDVYVSGFPGEAAAGLRLMARDEHRHPLVARFLYPSPRVALGLELRPWASACIDISDGLAVDLTRLAVASGAGARIDLDALPCSPAMKAEFTEQESQYLALNGGDDYELCFCVARARREAFEAWCQDGPHAITRIGALVEGDALVLHEDGEVVYRTLTGFDHFSEED